MNRVFQNIPILWINLNDSTVRNNKMVMQLNNYNNNFRIEAIDGRNKDSFFKTYDLNYINYHGFSTGLIAVICSHIKAIYHSFNKNYEHVCIFEDDVNFELVNKFPHTINDILEKAPPNWEIIQLYYCENLENFFADYIENGLNIYEGGEIYSGSAYIINKNGMKKILEKVETDGISKFYFKTPITSPEMFIYSSCGLNYYKINCPFIYNYDTEMTFLDYFEIPTLRKINCQSIQLKAKNSITNFFENNFSQK